MVVVEVADGVTATSRRWSSSSSPPGRGAPAVRQAPTGRSRRRAARAALAEARRGFCRQLRDVGAGRRPSAPGPLVASSRRMSTPAVTNGNGTGARPAAPAPPHSIEAEQSVLGAILLSDRVHYAFVIEEGAAARGLLPRAPPGHLRVDARRSTPRASRSTCSPSPSTCARAASSRRPAARPRSTRSPAPCPAVGNLRRYGADRQASTRSCAGCSTRPTRSRPASTATTAPPREIVERAERRCSRSPTTTARRTSAASARSCTRRSTSGSSSPSRAARSPARRRASPTSTRSPAASSPAT